MRIDLSRLKNGLIVSCQASPGWPLYGSEYMVRMAIAAKEGGAVALRANGTEDIIAIKQAVDLPVIGVNKVYKEPPTAFSVNITPNYATATAIIEAGCDIVALDTTARGRSWQDVKDIIAEIRKNYPEVPIMADLSTLEEALMAAEMGVDIISTTLSGYTNTSLGVSEAEGKLLSQYPAGAEPPPDYQLIRDIRAHTKVLINAEGRFWEIAQAQEAFRCGADMITVGSAITAPQKTTKRFYDALKEVHNG